MLAGSDIFYKPIKNVCVNGYKWLVKNRKSGIMVYKNASMLACYKYLKPQ